MPGDKDHMRMALCDGFNIVDHIGIIGMLEILRCTKNSTCNGVDRTDNRKRDIQVLYHIGKWEKMLLPSKETTMNAVTSKRMMSGNEHQFFIIPGQYILQLRDHFILGFIGTVRFDSRFIVRMNPPL